MNAQERLQQRAQLEYLIEALKPVICPDCGSRMSLTKVEDSNWVGKYDGNGKRQHMVIFKCPNSRWWHFQMIHSHRGRLVKER